MLQKLKLGLWNLLDGGLGRLLREKLTLDVTDRVAQARAALCGRRVLVKGSPALVTTVAITRLLPGEVTSQTGALVLHPVLIGSAEVAFADPGDSSPQSVVAK